MWTVIRDGSAKCVTTDRYVDFANHCNSLYGQSRAISFEELWSGAAKGSGGSAGNTSTASLGKPNK
jgi:hypothetical protein